MWNCNIDHLTIYHYEQEVSLEPHIIRQFPRLDRFRRLISSQINIDPTPQGHFAGIDAFGNQVDQIWFLGKHAHLKIHAKISLQIEAYNPFHFVIFPIDAMEQKYYRSVLLPKALAPYTEKPEGSDEEAKLIATCLEKGKGEVIPFLHEMTRHIYVSFQGEEREWGPAKTPGQTIQDGKGSCRDLSVLFIQLCRLCRIPARFTSGYHIQTENKSELHAWAEVFIFGAGWVGFDPSMGTICNWRYLPLASGIEQQDTMPVSGSFFGAGTSHLDSKIMVQLIKQA